MNIIITILKLFSPPDNKPELNPRFDDEEIKIVDGYKLSKIIEKNEQTQKGH